MPCRRVKYCLWPNFEVFEGAQVIDGKPTYFTMCTQWAKTDKICQSSYSYTDSNVHPSIFAAVFHHYRDHTGFGLIAAIDLAQKWMAKHGY
jgi:hypothetical protein